MKKQTDEHIEVGGKRVTLTHPDKVMYPATDMTKRDVVDYYVRVAPVMLPHLRGFPVSLKRYPDGVKGQVFFTKRCPANRPPFVVTAGVPHTSDVATVNACIINNEATLAWAANLAALEIHAHLFLASSPDRPKRVVFDLDPGAPAKLIDCCRVALLLRGVLESMNLSSFAKVSGSKGLHVIVPLNTQATFDASARFARTISQSLETRYPDQVTSVMTKKRRNGKVLIDWSQNARHKTTVAVYSLRGKDRPTVSLPVSWGEIRDAVKSDDGSSLICEWKDALQRIAALGDLFRNVLTLKQRLPSTRVLDTFARERLSRGQRVSI